MTALTFRFTVTGTTAHALEQEAWKEVIRLSGGDSVDADDWRVVIDADAVEARTGASQTAFRHYTASVTATRRAS